MDSLKGFSQNNLHCIHEQTLYRLVYYNSDWCLVACYVLSISPSLQLIT